MKLIEALDTWFLRMQLKPQTYRRYCYEIAIFGRHGGTLQTDITPAEQEAWRMRAVKSSVSPRTIESVLSSMRTLCRVAGNQLPVGTRVRYIRKPKPTPTFDEFCRVIDVACWCAGKRAEWWKRWLCWAYCTGLRRGDLLRMTQEHLRGDAVELVAEKTGKRQVIPIPERLERGQGDFLRVGIKQLRHALRCFCGAANVPTFTPQGIRRLSAKSWERAHAGCGAVILGHAVPGWTAATASYLDGSDLLRIGLPRLALPPMIADAGRCGRETEIVRLASSLPDADQAAALGVLRAMTR